MKILEKQFIFSRFVARLIMKAETLGYRVTLGEAWRSPETNQLYAEKGIGTARSLHSSRLAIDLNLFRHGKYLTDTEEYHELGVWWELQSTDEYECCWGGRFKKRDGNHFSISHYGRQ